MKQLYGMSQNGNLAEAVKNIRNPKLLILASNPGQFEQHVKELEELYNTADIAVSSLGMHRIGFTTGQTLKSKEYGAKGLPVISEYKVPEYPEGKQYQLVVPMDESPLNIEKVIEMYDCMPKETLQEQRETIRETVRSEADIKAVMKPVAMFFNPES